MPSITELPSAAAAATHTSDSSRLKAADRARLAKDEGNGHFKSGRWAEAVGCYSQAIVLDPTSAIYPLNRAQAYLKLDKFEDAERDCTRAIELDKGTNPKAWFRRAVARRSLADFEAAAKDLFQVVKLDPTQSGPVEAEMVKLRAEQAAFTARKGKGPATASVHRKSGPASAAPASSAPLRTTVPASTSSSSSSSSRPSASSKPVSIPIKMVYDLPVNIASSSPAPLPSTNRAPFAPMQPQQHTVPAPSPAPVQPFDPASNARSPEVIAVPASAAVTPSRPSQPPLPTNHTSRPSTTFAPADASPIASVSDAKNIEDDEGTEDAPRGLLSSASASRTTDVADPSQLIFGSLTGRSSSNADPAPPSSTPGPTSPAFQSRPSQRQQPLPTSAYALQAALTPLLPSARLALLRGLPPAKLPSIVGSSLEAPLVDLILSALSADADNEAPAARLGEQERADFVRGLEGAKRWGMVLMMTPRGRERWAAFKAGY